MADNLYCNENLNDIMDKIDYVTTNRIENEISKYCLGCFSKVDGPHASHQYFPSFRDSFLQFIATLELPISNIYDED
jgi:hypothetical protein